MAALNVIGDWLEDSSWIEAKVASTGTAQSFLKASHVTRTRHAHQVTAGSLYITEEVISIIAGRYEVKKADGW